MYCTGMHCTVLYFRGALFIGIRCTGVYCTGMHISVLYWTGMHSTLT